MSNQELIQKAASVIKPKNVGEFAIGDVGAALITETGNLYLGVCIDTSSSMGFCAEHNAIGTMVTGGEYKIKKIVAVWKDEEGKVYVVSPCGRCREFMRQIDPANLETEVILDENKVLKLKDLLPYSEWYREQK